MLDLIAFGVALTAFVSLSNLSRISKPELQEDRYAELDSIRGLLALSVFVYHGVIWRGVQQGGGWQEPSSDALKLLGPGSVLVFFMITGFLFGTKIWNSRTKSINWTLFFKSRLLRLVPLYWISVFSMFVLAYAFGTDSVPWLEAEHFKRILNWLLFLPFKAQDVFGMKETGRILAGAAWSLIYEWMFYCFLPLIHALFTRRLTILAVASALLGLLLFVLQPPTKLFFLAFAIGICTAIFRAKLKDANSFNGSVSAILACSALVAAFFLPGHPISLLKLVLLGCFFVPLAMGNSFWGILRLRALREIGNLTYGIYLIHGIMLFLVYKLMGALFPSALGRQDIYVVIIAMSSCLLFLVSRWIYANVELRAMKFV